MTLSGFFIGLEKTNVYAQGVMVLDGESVLRSFRSLMKRAKKMIKSFIAGIKYKFPLCCVIAFCLGKSNKGVVMRDNDPYDVWRPCFLHKNTAISNKEHLLLLNDGDIGWISEGGTFDINGMFIV